MDKVEILVYLVVFFIGLVIGLKLSLSIQLSILAALILLVVIFHKRFEGLTIGIPIMWILLFAFSFFVGDVAFLITK